MNTLIILISFIVGFLGLALAAWSAVNTRNKYYNDFMERKPGREKFRLPR